MVEPIVVGGFRLKEKFPAYCCPFCGEQVGYVGRGIMWLFGAAYHGCDFSNTMHPQMADYHRKGTCNIHNCPYGCDE